MCQRMDYGIRGQRETYVDDKNYGFGYRLSLYEIITMFVFEIGTLIIGTVEKPVGELSF